MSNKSAAVSPVRNHTLFSHKSIIIIGLFIVGVYLLTVFVYPLIYNSEQNKNNSINQPVAVPATTPVL